MAAYVAANALSLRSAALRCALRRRTECRTSSIASAVASATAPPTPSSSLLLGSHISRGMASSSTTWTQVPMGPPDPILGLNEAYKRDQAPEKVNLGVGAYRDETGKPVVLPSVQQASARLLERKEDHEYAPIAGLPGFASLAAEFMYGADSSVLRDNRLAAVQSLSGTGALRIMGEFIRRFLGAETKVYVPDPTWGNHHKIFADAGLEVVKYRYYDPATIGLDFEGMCHDIEAAPAGSVILLHACAHNPTGIDPTVEQWKTVSKLLKDKGHVVAFDSAYQGFASGDADADAHAVRSFVDDGHNLMLAQSFAKNFGLYGERVGALSVVCNDTEEAERVLSQLKILIRPMYSNPPVYGARVVKEILSDPALKQAWYKECKGMADRIDQMRSLLRAELEERNAGNRSWRHITDQIGMFCFSGLTAQQVERMINDHHIYMTKDGRISMAGVTRDNVTYLAESIANVLK